MSIASRGIEEILIIICIFPLITLFYMVKWLNVVFHQISHIRRVYNSNEFSHSNHPCRDYINMAFEPNDTHAECNTRCLKI